MESAEPGPWNPDRAPYLDEVMDACADKSFARVVMMKVPQTGLSEASRNVLGYWIDQDPGPVQLVMPSDDSVKETIEERVFPLIDQTDCLEVHKTTRSHDMKRGGIRLDNMFIFTGSAASPNSLARRPIQRCISDEVDKFPPFSGRESSPIKLADHRLTTYKGRSKHILISTPTTEDGPIYQEFEACADKRYFHVPCPRCDEYQHLKFFGGLVWTKPGDVIRVIREFAGGPLEVLQEQLRELGLAVAIEDLESSPDDTIRNLGIPDPADTTAVAEWIENEGLAHYRCEHCGHRIEENSKAQMLIGGRWLSEGQTISSDGAIGGQRRPSKRVGFQISALYSPWVPWGEIAADFLRARGNPSLMMDFFNGRLGEPFKQQVNVIKVGAYRDKADLMRRRVEDDVEPGAGIVPSWAGLVLLAVDTQKDHFWYTVRAWGHQCMSKLLRHGEVRKEDELIGLLDARWPIEGLNDVYMQAARLFIDSGGGVSADEESDLSRTDEVYRFSLSDPRIVATKGLSRLDAKPYRFSNVEKGSYKVELCLVNVHHYKDVLHHRIYIEPGNPGEWMVHESIDDEYARQMSAERKIIKRSGPRKGRQVWEPLSAGTPNHLWDCEVLQCLGADILNADIISPPDQLVQQRRRQLQQQGRKRRSDSWLPQPPDWSAR